MAAHNIASIRQWAFDTLKEKKNKQAKQCWLWLVSRGVAMRLQFTLRGGRSQALSDGARKLKTLIGRLTRFRSLGGYRCSHCSFISGSGPALATGFYFQSVLPTDVRAKQSVAPREIAERCVTRKATGVARDSRRIVALVSRHVVEIMELGGDDKGQKTGWMPGEVEAAAAALQLIQKHRGHHCRTAIKASFFFTLKSRHTCARQRSEAGETPPKTTSE
jgi:hypothetical protein